MDVLNPPAALLGAHDKLETALRLGARGIPHPRTSHFDEDAPGDLDLPAVLKPRFGSWGHDVIACSHRFALRRACGCCDGGRGSRGRESLAQELIPSRGRDLRLLVAGGEVVGAIERVARPGEWRTNVALGGERLPLRPPTAACDLAVQAAEAIGADLVGVDLLPDGHGGYVVLELNGAADFTDDYSLDGTNVFERAVDALTRYAREYEAPSEEAALAARVRA